MAPATCTHRGLHPALSGGVTYGHICLAPLLPLPFPAVPAAPAAAPGCSRRSPSRSQLSRRARAVRVPPSAETPREPLPRSGRASGSCSSAASPPQCCETARPGTRNYTSGETRWRQLFPAVAKELVPLPPGVSAHGQPAVGDAPVSGARTALASADGACDSRADARSAARRKLQLPAATATRRSPGRGLRGTQSPRPLRVLRK